MDTLTQDSLSFVYNVACIDSPKPMFPMLFLFVTILFALSMSSQRKENQIQPTMRSSKATSRWPSQEANLTSVYSA